MLKNESLVRFYSRLVAKLAEENDLMVAAKPKLAEAMKEAVTLFDR